MNHQRTISDSFEFTAAQPERIYRVPGLQRDQLADITLAFWTEQSFPESVLQTSELPELRIYFDGKDITEPVRRELIRTLESANQTSLRKAYQEGLDRWLSLLAKMDIPEAGTRKTQSELARTMLHKPWREHFSQLSNRNGGYRGGLHPFNFIYRELQIEEISLRNILFPSAGTDEPVFAGVQDFRVILAHGPSRFFERNWQPVKALYEGRITAAVSFIYCDSWESEMKEKLQSLHDLMLDLDARIVGMKEAVTKAELRSSAFESTASKIEKSVSELGRFLGMKG